MELQEPLDNQDIPELRELLGLMEPPVLMELQVPQAKTVSTAHQGHKDPKANLVHQDRLLLQAVLGLPVLLVHLVEMAHLVALVDPGPLDLKDLLGLWDQLDHLAEMVFLELPVQKEKPAHQVSLVHRVKMEHLVYLVDLGPLALKDLKVPVEQMALLEKMAFLAALGHQGRKEYQADLVHQVLCNFHLAFKSIFFHSSMNNNF